MTVQTEKYHHGKSPAAWSAMAIALLGSLIGTVGFFMNINWTLVIVGLIVLAVAPIVGGALRKMGYGTE